MISADAISVKLQVPANDNFLQNILLFFKNIGEVFLKQLHPSSSSLPSSMLYVTLVQMLRTEQSSSALVSVTEGLVQHRLYRMFSTLEQHARLETKHLSRRPGWSCRRLCVLYSRMRPSPLSAFTACVSTSPPLLAELVLSLILTFVGIFEITSFRFSCDDSPKFRTMRKILSMPSISLAYTTKGLSVLRQQNQPLLRSSSLARSELNS